MKKILLYLFFLANLAIIIFFWQDNSGSLLFRGRAPMFISLGRLAGLLAVFFILSQIILIGRVKWVERIFGFDKLSIAHHYAAFFAITFILLHPIFLVLGYGESGGYSFLEQLWQFLFNYDDLWSPFIAVILFIIVFVTSIIVVLRKYQYEWWYFTHLLVYAAILLGFSHELKLGGDFRNELFAGYWIFLYIFTFFNLAFYRLFRPLYLFYRHRFCVEKIIRENKSAVSIYISGKNMESFKFLPGQFALWRFLNKKIWWQSHPFSFSMAPNGENLRLTVKDLGNFTHNVNNANFINSGDYVLLDGPHGIFTPKRSKNDKLLLIAGGAGITPLRSILENERGRKNIIFLYGNKTKDDVIFEKELLDLEGERLKIFHILSDDYSGSSEKGFIDEEKIRRLAPDFILRDVYLCGPPAMMKILRKTLRGMGIRKERIYFEKFSLGE